MTLIGPITMEIAITLEIARWTSIETRVPPPLSSGPLVSGSVAEVYVDGNLIRGCSGYTVSVPVRGILTATLTLSPAVERSGEQVLELLQRWGAVKVDR